MTREQAEFVLQQIEAAMPTHGDCSGLEKARHIMRVELGEAMPNREDGGDS